VAQCPGHDTGALQDSRWLTGVADGVGIPGHGVGAQLILADLPGSGGHDLAGAGVQRRAVPGEQDVTS
jgi:hypothetical protein